MTRYLIAPDAAFAAVEDGAVVLHMGTKRYYSLNSTGAAVWRLLEDGAPRGELAARMTQAFVVERAEAEHTITTLLAELVAERLLVEVSE